MSLSLVPEPQLPQQTLPELLRPSLEPMARDLAEQVIGDGSYAEEGLLTVDELQGACLANLTAITDSLSGHEPDMRPAVMVGRLKAERGIPIAALLHAFRLGGRIVWRQLTELSRGPGDPELHALAAPLWELIDVYSDAASDAYRDAEVGLANASAGARNRLVRILFDDHSDHPARALAAMRSLGIPEHGTFAIAAVLPPDSDAPLPADLEAALRMAGATTAWDSRPDGHVGLLSFHSPSETDRSLDRLGGLVGGRIGLSSPFTSATGISSAIAEARLAARSAGPGDNRVVRYGTDPTAQLLVTVPEEGRRIADQILGPILRRPAPERDDLIAMLHAWYDCHGSTNDVAKRLHCHRNTVRYRLNKLTDLTGRDITDPAQSAELHLALRAHALLRAHEH